MTEPPVGLEVALKEVDAELDTMRLESQDTSTVVLALLLLLTNDQERAEHALSLADDRRETVQARLAAENAASIPF